MKYGQFVEAVGEFARQINFLAKAVYRDDDGIMLQHISIEPSEKAPGKLLGVSTDGRRLHKVDPLSCPDTIGVTEGAWHVLRSGNSRRSPWIVQLKDEGKFPNWKKVIPGGKPTFEGTFKGIPVTDLNMKGYVVSSMVELFRSFPEPTLLNLNYLCDMGTDYDWDVHWYDKNSALAFYSRHMTAFFMPLRSGE